MAGLGVGDPVPFGRVARTVPGEVVLVAGLALGVVAVLAPMWVGLADRVRRAVADEAER